MLLEVENLHTTFGDDVAVVAGASFEIARGQTLALVGESGCGKSMTALSIMRLVPVPGRISAGRIVFDGRDLLALDERQMRRLRGDRIAMIFQEPMSSLNPVLTVGAQIVESLRLHRGLALRAARRRCVELLREVGIPDPQRRVGEYPHQMSGGMRQRVMIAMALACQPDLLIADEPTTALDVTVQAQILELLRRLQVEHQMAILLITHDLGIVAGCAQRVCVMYSGRIVESAPAAELFARPQHPYTQALLESVPRLEVGGPTPRRLKVIPGEVPRPEQRPGGCAFHPRCELAGAHPPCRHAVPALRPAGPQRCCACHLREAAPAG